MSDDLEARGHHAITHEGETYIKLADASVTFSLYRKDIAAKDARIAELEKALKINFHKHVQGASAADVVITRILPYSVSDVELKKLAGGEDE